MGRVRHLLITGAALGLVLPVAIAVPATGDTTTPGGDPSAAPGVFNEQNLAADRTAEDFFYRITALTHVRDGVLLAAWDARPDSAADAPNPNSIVMRRSTDNGKTWDSMSTIAAGHPGDATGKKYGYSDPSFVTDHEAGKVFAFFVYSKDQGFHGSAFGNDDDDRQVISAAVAESTDEGRTWSEPRLITDVAKPGASKTPSPGDVRSMFASSGEGIQLRHGEHRGRLIQQFAGDVQQSDGTRAMQAYSVYSDDHGATWHRGELVGTGMDENKVVELSDGRVMLNSRDSNGGGFRKVTISEDGGETYGQVTADRQLPDPTNNAELTSMFPNAAEGSDDARKLLYTGANSQTERENVSARVSCDDGATWPGLRTIRSGTSAYSSTTALDSGIFGTFYEAGYTNDLRFSAYDQDWLNVVCAPLEAEPLEIDPDETANVPVTVTNQEATRLPAGQLTISGPAGWTAKTVEVPAVASGKSTMVEVPVTSPATANGPVQLQSVFTAADGRESQGPVTAEVEGKTIVGISVEGEQTDSNRDVDADPYAARDQVPYSFVVSHTGNVTQWVVPTDGNFAPFAAQPVGDPSPAGNCRYGSLAVGTSYNCTSPRHTVTDDDVADGFFVPRTTWTVGQVPEYTNIDQTLEVTGEEVDVLRRAPELSETHDDGAFIDVDGDGYASTGDTVTTTLTLENTGNVRLTDVTTGDHTAAKELSTGGTTTHELQHTVSSEDVESGAIAAQTVKFTAANGSKSTSLTAKLAAISLDVSEDIDPGAPSDNESTAPTAASLSHDNGWDTGLQDGDFTVSMNLWHGSNASLFRLYEDGELVSVSKLKAKTPEAQKASFSVEGKKNGTYTYTGELVNAAGSTKTAPLKVRVTDAAPALPVLSRDHQGTGGDYTLTANLWWGTNGETYRLLEDGRQIATGKLDASSPAAQQVEEKISGRKSGTYEYVVEFSNAAGTTASKPLMVKVK
ncbi:exo-alpha-sialidase [Arthrobacter sp. AOP36-A1-22]|uniref:exo-alpha-sialidase n=1 Tax=unclassified Arthrobacter TaxID=235627 RepID=UPI004033F3D2